MRVQADGQVEYMWIEYLTYRNGTFFGELVNKQ